MPKRLSLCLLLLTLTPIAHADDAAKQAKIEQLLQVIKVDQLMNQMAGQMLAQMNNMMKQQTAGSNFNPEQQKIVSNFTSKVDTLVHQQFDWNKVRPQFVTLYSDTYTEPEIDGLLAFYKSPVGQTMLAKLPELNAKSLQIGQSQVTPIIPQLRQMSQEFATQMTAAASKPATSAPAAKPAPSAKPAPAKP